jgi:aminotransferase
MDPPGYRLDLDRMRSLISSRTRAIVLNTPNNPTGRVFSRDELLGMAALARHHGFLVITDEIYEHILYEGQHIPVATLPGMRDLTITVSGLSKTFSITGWRVGTIIAPPAITAAIRKVHDFLTVGSPAPLQEACAVGLNELGEEYYWTLAHDYRKRRDIMVQALGGSRFSFQTPEGAYYILADFSALSDLDDVAFAHILTKEAGVATVPGSSFFRPAPEASPSRGSSLVRFAFCKKEKTLEEAGERLLAFARKIAGD